MKRCVCRYYDNYYRNNAALAHIQEATEFSNSLGGADKIVKNYFFSLPKNDFDRLLLEYKNLYGNKAYEYACETYEKWKTDKVKMSGVVAKRLFDLLPPRMPMKTKLEIAEKIWNHYNPSSTLYYVITPNTNLENFALNVANKLNDNIQIHSIPNDIKSNFKWLAAGDITVEEQLLNYFQECQKKLAIQKILLVLPILKKQFLENPNITHACESLIEINKHKIKIEIRKELYNNTLYDFEYSNYPIRKYYHQDKKTNDYTLIIFVAMIFGILTISSCFK